MTLNTTKQKSSSRLDVHNIESDIVACLDTLQKELSSENWNLVKKYNILLTTISMSKAARRSTLRLLLSLNRFNENKSWEFLNKDDVELLVYNIMNHYSKDGQETWSTSSHKRDLKMFLRWVKLGSRDFREVGDPDETKRIKIKTPKDTLAREDLISDKDRINMIAACDDLQSRALIDIADESACRPTELLTLNVSHVLFDQYGAKIKVDGKTGSRHVLLIRSSKNLLNWINNHPFKNERDSPLFIVRRKVGFGNRMSYAGAVRILKNAAKKAGINKPITFTIERHSGATNAANMLNEAQMRHRHGWAKNSQMSSRYVHLIGSDVDDAMLKHYGLKKEDETPEIRKCDFCSTLNSKDVKMCETCDKPLDIQTALELDEERDTNNNSKIKSMEERLENIEKLLEQAMKSN